MNVLDKSVQSALGTQIAGDHYTSLAIQPMEYSERNRLTATQHTAIKYISREKGTLEDRLEDLDKAIHCIQLYKQSLVEDWADRRNPERIRRDIERLKRDLAEIEADAKVAHVPTSARGKRSVGRS